jgi:hypothetical protein
MQVSAITPVSVDMASDGQSFAHFKQRVHEARLITGIGGSKFINAKLEICRGKAQNIHRRENPQTES